MPQNPAVNVRSNDLEATSPYWRNGLLPAHTPSGRPDLNRRPLDPQSSALPNCATSRPSTTDPMTIAQRAAAPCQRPGRGGPGDRALLAIP